MGRVVVYGAGAIGGVIGGRLAEHGHEVVLIARGAHGRALREQGLRLESPEGTVTLAIPCVEHPGELEVGADDLVLLAMKTQDTDAALDELAGAVRGAPPAIACAQNGVENERLALRRFPEVYAVCVMCPATHLEPGVVQASSSPVTGILDVGRVPFGGDGSEERAAAIAEAFESATFVSVARDDIMRWKYSKLLMNLGNVVQAAFAPSEAANELSRRARHEGRACLEAAGIDVASAAEDRERRGDLLQLRPVAGSERSGGSTWQSLARGAPRLETDYLNGEIVLLGRRRGLDTPINEALQQLGRRLVAEGVGPEGGDLEAFLAELGLPPLD
jgi:2-dehydropantoate 2-reductase